MKVKNEEFSLKDLLSLFLPKIWIILLCGIIAAGGMGVYSMFIKADTYTCTSSLISSKQNNNLSTTDVELASKMIDTYKEVVFRKDFLNVVCEEINNNNLYPAAKITPELLRSICTMNKCNETDVFDIKVVSTDPTLSYVVCKTMAEVIDEKLPSKLPYPTGVVTLNIVQNASPEDAMIKNDKNLARNTVIGFLVGVVISMVAIYLYSILDVVVRDKKRLEDNLDVPVLGVIPRIEVDKNNVREMTK